MIKMKLCWFSFLLLGLCLVEAKNPPCMNLTLYGKHVVGLCFNKAVTTVNQARKELDVKTVDKTVQLINQFIDDVLLNNKPITVALEYAEKFDEIIKANKIESSALEAKRIWPKLSLRFVFESIGVMKTAVKVGELEFQFGKQIENLSVEKVAQNTKQFFNLMRDIVEKSPTGSYLNLSFIKIDEKPLGDIAASIVKDLHFNKSTKQVLTIFKMMIEKIEHLYE